jgi:O-antigen/teichoic acid export membrane protein
LPAVESSAPSDHAGSELKRGMFFNALALFGSNFRGVFTFLIARLLGPSALGVFSVGWATTDILTNVGNFGLEETITTFIARAQAKGDTRQAGALARLAISLAVAQCTVLALVAIGLIAWLGPRFGLDPRMASATCVLLGAMPGVSLYRLSTAVSRGMKVMQHDIFSRGMTEPLVTSAAFLVLLSLGYKLLAPQLAAIIGTALSGIVAVFLALSLFRNLRGTPPGFSRWREARALLTYGGQITSYSLLNSFIVRIDVLMLALFIGKAPGVTLPVVGVYAAAVEVGGGLRKANQVFNPIFAPVVAGLTHGGDQEHAALIFARVAQWMLWLLLPLLAVLALAGSLILSIYGPAFREGAFWLAIVALACATNCFVSLAETVIMVQRPGLNLVNSGVTCIVAVAANWWLIRWFGVTGAAFGILLPYVLLGVLRHRTLRLVFGWKRPWHNLAPPFVAAIVAAPVAIVCRVLLHGILAEVVSALVFLAIFGAQWWWKFRRGQA